MPYPFGTETKTTIKVGPEAHKLHLEFEVYGDIHVGQPVKLHPDGNKVMACGANEPEANIIGISMHEGYSAYGDYVTIAVRGYVVIMALADDGLVLVPGPVAYVGYDEAQAYTGNTREFGGYNVVNSCIATKVIEHGGGGAAINVVLDQFGWVLDVVAANTPVRVLVKN